MAYDHGRSLEAEGRPSDAERSYRRAIDLCPTHAEAHFHLGRLLLERGDTAGAEAAWRAAVTAAPHYAEAHFHLGRLLLERGDEAGAEAGWRAAVTAAPHYAEAWNGLGQRLEARGAGAEALDAYGQACRAADHYADPWRRALSLIERQGPRDHPLRTALLDRIDAHIAAAGIGPAGGRPRLVWYFARIERFGHLATELSHLKMIYGAAFSDIIVLCRPRRRAANAALFEILTRGVTVVEIEDDLLDVLTREGELKLERGDTTYALYTYTLAYEVFLRFQAGHPPAFTTLSDEDRRRGRDLARRLNIGDQDRVVIVHARERGYQETVVNPNAFGTTCEDLSVHHNGRIGTYVPAIRFLVDQGYVVIRMGDPSMTRLPDLGPRVIDLPFHESYDPMLDVYFSAICVFMMGGGSGPTTLAGMFGRPGIHVNEVFPLAAFELCGFPQLWMFKKAYRATPDGREYLSLRRLLEMGAQDVTVATELQDLGLTYEDNSPEEILAVCREMLECLAHPAPPVQPEHEIWVALCRAERGRRLARDPARTRQLILFETPYSRLSAAYCRLNPWLLADAGGGSPEA